MSQQTVENPEPIETEVEYPEGYDPKAGQDLTVATERPMAPADQVSGLSPMVQAVMSGNLNTEQMREMLDIQKDYEKNEARKAFFAALAEYKKNPADVIHDKENKQFGSTYSSRSNLVNTVNRAMSPYGLSARWEVSQGEKTISVTCILSHAMGHSEKVTLSAPPDTSGAKNPIQQIKSTITYLEIVTFEAVTGTASRAGDLDDDGNSAGNGVERVSEEQAANIRALMEEVGANEPAFCKYMMAKSVEDIRADQYDHAIKMLNEKRKRGHK